MEPIMELSQAEVFFDGTTTEPQLDHPEGIAVDRDGSILCGGERGQIFRLDPQGKSITQVASTGGFALGMALDGRGSLFVCDLKHAALFRLDLGSGAIERFADGMRIPNYPVVDTRRNRIYVSDSHEFGKPGPGIWSVDLASGTAELWYDGPLNFANGMALSPDGAWLYVLESFARRVIRIALGPDGKPGKVEVRAEEVGRVPDGLAFDARGNLYVTCYEPSCIYRLSPDGDLSLLIADIDAHTLCHPTNCAFRGSDLFTSNLGRWHITRIPVGIDGVKLPV